MLLFYFIFLSWALIDFETVTRRLFSLVVFNFVDLKLIEVIFLSCIDDLLFVALISNLEFTLVIGVHTWNTHQWMTLMFCWEIRVCFKLLVFLSFFPSFFCFFTWANAGIKQKKASCGDSKILFVENEYLPTTMKLNPRLRHVFLVYAHNLLLKLCTSVSIFFSFFLSLRSSASFFSIKLRTCLTRVVHTGVAC